MTEQSYELSILLTEEEISRRVVALADRLNKDFKGRKPILISVLSGSFLFTSDLVRNIDFDHILTFTKVKSYQGMNSTLSFDFQLNLKEVEEERELIVIEDIIDTGSTLDFLMEELEKKKPRSIDVVTLLLKPEVYKYSYQVKYVGFEIPDDFVVGYGLDYNHKYRNLRDIYVFNQIK